MYPVQEAYLRLSLVHDACAPSSLLIAREHFVTKYTITDVSKRGGAHDVTQVLFFFIVVSITQCTAVSRSVSMWSSDLAGTQAKMDPD